MLKILFCFSCCGAPPSSRPARGKAAAVKSNEKLVEEANFKSLLTMGEKDQLLANQIHSNNNDNYGVKDSNNISPQQQQQQPEWHQQLADQQQLEARLKTEDDSFQASTSAQGQTFVPKLGAGGAVADRRAAALDGFSAAYRAGESLVLYDEASISPQSSIDVESFREDPDAGDGRTMLASYEQNQPQMTVSKQQQQQPPPSSRESSVAAASSSATLVDQTATSTTLTYADATTTSSSSAVAAAAAAIPKTITSTTKIGDYARLEYSPVEDLESVTTYSYSRGGSERGSAAGPSRGGDQSRSRPDSLKTGSGNVSRRSSQGFESTSISIASQLSNEQFQQNLTNMLESANSPIPPQQLFGTIGLPLGPPLDSGTSETAKTSPETTGAALTSASQDSLSGAGSIDSVPTSRAATLGSTSMGGGGGGGAALVNDSIEDSAEMVELSRDPMNGDEGTAQLASGEDDLLPPAERIESSLSMATTTSGGGLTNPTPTPSEMSGASATTTTTSNKKKSKLRAGKLLKKLKPGGSKKKNKDTTGADDK